MKGLKCDFCGYVFTEEYDETPYTDNGIELCESCSDNWGGWLHEKDSRIAELEAQLHQASAEWSEEKKRNAELEAQLAHKDAVVDLSIEHTYSAIFGKDPQDTASAIQWKWRLKQRLLKQTKGGE